MKCPYCYKGKIINDEGGIEQITNPILGCGICEGTGHIEEESLPPTK